MPMDVSTVATSIVSQVTAGLSQLEQTVTPAGSSSFVIRVWRPQRALEQLTVRRIDLKKASVARSNTIRDINRQIVLNYVRELGPISRADIARETALQRSTVSLIVDELTTDGLIEEVTGESSGGRPPSLISLRTADAVAIDLHATAELDLLKFQRLASQWREETSALSSDSDIVANFAYHQIIGMGKPALPLIFNEMQAHGGRWFWALRAITGENPVRPEDRGNVRRMTETWLLWARERDYVR